MYRVYHDNGNTHDDIDWVYAVSPKQAAKLTLGGLVDVGIKGGKITGVVCTGREEPKACFNY